MFEDHRTMSRRFSLLLLAAALSVAWRPCSPAWARSELIPETTAAEHGLSRPWFTQVKLDQGRGQLLGLVLYDGTLYAQTDKAVVHAINAETGETLWWKQVGRPQHLTMTPGANRDLLAVINGSRLYVLNRQDGDVLLERELSSTPGAGAALSATRVYVPLRNGLIVAYRLEPPPEPGQESGGNGNKKNPAPEAPAPSEPNRSQSLRLRQDLLQPAFCQSYGQARVQPLVTRENAVEEFVVWPTDRGYLNLARIDRKAGDFLLLKYRLPTGAEIVGRPAYLPPDPKITGDSGLIVAVSRDGYVYVVQETTGDLLWRYSIGDPIVESPAVFEDRIYVTAQLGGMHCLAVKTGEEIWIAPGVVQFVAASKTKVYAADGVGRLVVLDAQSGARRDVFPAEDTPIKVLNTQTDRIYLADKAGLIQCLREVQQTEPIVYGKDRRQAEAQPAAAAQKEVQQTPKPAKKAATPPKPRPTKKAAKKKAIEAAEGDDAAAPANQ
jgi:outer membrane protein assembly factor BamB